MSIESVKFPVKVYKYDGGSDYYDLTLTEISSKCCIYSQVLYWTKTIPQEEACVVDVFHPRLYDVWNYECVPWWEWPEELQKYVLDAVKLRRS